MKQSLFFACLCSMLINLTSCEKKDAANGDSVDEITIYGNVIDRTTGLPLYNVLIQEKNNVGGSSVTGNDGNYEFKLPLNGSSSGMFKLIATKSLYIDAQYELSLNSKDKGRKIKVDFQLEKGIYHIEGKVTDMSGAPLVGVLVKETYQNSGISTYTDDNGEYKLDLTPYSDDVNKYILTASKTNYYQQEYTINLSTKDYGRTSNVNFQLGNGVFHIEGKVTDQNGQPLSDVLIKETYHNMGTSAYSDHTGYYKLDLVPYSMTTNRYVLVATKTDFNQQEISLSFTTNDYGNTTTVNFQLVTSVAPVLYCYIDGVVKTIGYSPVPVPNIVVYCYKAKTLDMKNKLLEQQVKSETDGTFTIKQKIDIDYPYHIYQAKDSYYNYFEYNGVYSSTGWKLTTEEGMSGEHYMLDISTMHATYVNP